MKMSVGTRIVFSLFLIVILALCGLVIAASFGAFAVEDILALAHGFTDTGFKYIWAAAALFLAVIALCLLFFHTKEAPVTAVVLDNSADGSVAVSVEALRELANHYLKSVQGIVIQRIDIVPLAYKSIRLNLAISVRPEVQVPELTKRISEEIKQYVETYSGISADQLHIRILPLKQNPPAAV